jgi:hypothetical protein
MPRRSPNRFSESKKGGPVPSITDQIRRLCATLLTRKNETERRPVLDDLRDLVRQYDAARSGIPAGAAPNTKHGVEPSISSETSRRKPNHKDNVDEGLNE